MARSKIAASSQLTVVLECIRHCYVNNAPKPSSLTRDVIKCLVCRLPGHIKCRFISPVISVYRPYPQPNRLLTGTFDSWVKTSLWARVAHSPGRRDSGGYFFSRFTPWTAARVPRANSQLDLS